MRLTNILQGDYTQSRSYYQIKLPIDLEPMIPDNDPVRLLNACVEGMDLSELYKTYTRVPKNLATPKQLFKIVDRCLRSYERDLFQQEDRSRLQAEHKLHVPA